MHMDKDNSDPPQDLSQSIKCPPNRNEQTSVRVSPFSFSGAGKTLQFDESTSTTTKVVFVKCVVAIIFAYILIIIIGCSDIILESTADVVQVSLLVCVGILSALIGPYQAWKGNYRPAFIFYKVSAWSALSVIFNWTKMIFVLV